MHFTCLYTVYVQSLENFLSLHLSILSPSPLCPLSLLPPHIFLSLTLPPPFPLSLPSALFPLPLPLPLPCSLSCHLPHRVRKPRFSSVLRLEIVVLAFGRNSHSSVKQNPYKCLPVSRQPFACNASLPRPLQPWHSGRTGECESHYMYMYMYNVQCIIYIL